MNSLLISNYIESIDNIYQTININRSIIIYNDSNYHIILELFNALIEKDYPCIIIQENIEINYDNFRIYIIIINNLNLSLNLSDISVIIYLDNNDYNNIINNFNNIDLIKI
jgi:hypothetical protein